MQHSNTASTFAGAVTTHDNPSEEGDSNMTDNNEAARTQTDGKTSNSFYLQFSKGAKPFNLPDWAEVAAKGMEHFNDPGLRCPRRRLGAEYVYQ